MENFTPGSAAVGGVLIGCATLLLWILNGRVAGISGILGGLAQAPSDDRWWRVAFIGGLIVAPLVFSAISVHGVPPIAITASPWLLVPGGLLVGFGTRLGGGCTSGHGVCGAARLSKRSLVATATFMASGVIVVFLLRHVFGI
jgi:uncharacterized membrane protein YedE/YeeE